MTQPETYPNAIRNARAGLYDALATGTNLPVWRVWRWTPGQITSPCIFIDSVELSNDAIEGASFVTATFPVVIVADGTVRPQMEQLDDVLAFVWDAARTVGEPTDSSPTALDVGGPTLRAHVVRVGMIITARTLCPSHLVTTGGNP